jgi:hypothetical protein
MYVCVKRARVDVFKIKIYSNVTARLLRERFLQEKMINSRPGIVLTATTTSVCLRGEVLGVFGPKNFFSLLRVFLVQIFSSSS